MIWATLFGGGLMLIFGGCSEPSGPANSSNPNASVNVAFVSPSPTPFADPICGDANRLSRDTDRRPTQAPSHHHR